MALEYFPFYYSYRKKLAKLSDQEVGRLVRSLLEYGEVGETEELTGRESVAFDFIADDIDRAKAAYDEKCLKSKKSAEARYEKLREDTNECERIRTHTDVYERKEIKQKQNQNKTKTKQIETESACAIDPFDDFWKAYPKKVGKGDAHKAFAKVKAADRAKLIPALEKQKLSKQWQTEGGRFIPNPSTWLNQQRWEDELPIENTFAEKGCISHDAAPSDDDFRRLARMIEELDEQEDDDD